MTPREEAIRLKNEGYYSVSRKYHHLARVPPGISPRKALFQAAMAEYRGLPNEKEWEEDMTQWVAGMDIASVIDQYVRVYAKSITVSKEVFDEFLKIGGGPAR